VQLHKFTFILARVICLMLGGVCCYFCVYLSFACTAMLGESSVVLWVNDMAFLRHSQRGLYVIHLYVVGTGLIIFFGPPAQSL